MSLYIEKELQRLKELEEIKRRLDTSNVKDVPGTETHFSASITVSNPATIDTISEEDKKTEAEKEEKEKKEKKDKINKADKEVTTDKKNTDTKKAETTSNDTLSSQTSESTYQFGIDIDNGNKLDIIPKELQGVDNSEIVTRSLCMIKHELLAEIIESVGIGSDERYGLLDIPVFDYNKVSYCNYTEQIDVIVSGGGGDLEGWKAAVKEMAAWYEENIHEYNQGGYTPCPLIGDTKVRHDCSGYVTACLWKFGAFPTSEGPYASKGYTNDSSIAQKLSDKGFQQMAYSYDSLQEFDIITYDGHIEIYAGKIDGSDKSYAWGKCHDKAHGGLPCGMCKENYTKIFRMVPAIGVLGLLGGSFGSAGSFTGKSESEKWNMCGLAGASPNDSTVTSNLAEIPYSWGKGFKLNRALINDLNSIYTEVKQAMPGFDFKIGSAYRSNSSAGGKSRHQYGVAIDLNPGSAGNPWFNTHINPGDWSVNKPAGSSAPWGTKSCGYSGGYNPNKCVWSWDHPVVKIFNKHGWGWGGAYGDVMHFSISTYNASGGLGGR